MKLKTAFFLFSLLIITACGKNNKTQGEEISIPMELESFEMNETEFHLDLNGESELKLQAQGEINYLNIESSLLNLEDTPKCKFYEDSTISIVKNVLTKELTFYFDFFIDGEKIMPIFIENETILFRFLDLSASRFSMTLKNKFKGAVNLSRTLASNQEHCEGTLELFGRINYPLVHMGIFRTVEKLKKINFHLKLSKSFLP